MKRKIHILIVLVIILMVGIWMIDIGASVLIIEALGLKAHAQTLFLEMSGNTHYHLGIILVVLSFTILSFQYVELLFKQKKVKK